MDYSVIGFKKIYLIFCAHLWSKQDEANNIYIVSIQFSPVVEIGVSKGHISPQETTYQIVIFYKRTQNYLLLLAFQKAAV